MNLTCLVKQEGAQYASLCVELDVASCGATEEEALSGLKDAIDAYVEFMQAEGLGEKMYRPVPMDELRDFLFTEPIARGAVAIFEPSTVIPTRRRKYWRG